MAYEAKNFDHLLGMQGFSDKLLQTHFKLYQGYVANTNKVAEKLAALIKARDTGIEYAELKRRFGWEFNGMRLHELYFGNLKNGSSALDKESTVYKKIVEEFGSFEAWEKDFRATGAMRGIGWVVLACDCGDRVFNVWVNEHDVGHLAGVTPLLIMDVFEHAFVFDYGMNRAEYIDAFFKNIDWETVASRCCLK